MNRKEKDGYQKLLLERKKELGKKLSEFFNESKEVDSGSVQDLADKAESSYTKEFLLSLSDAERVRLRKIDDALTRLAKDEFGICRSCGKLVCDKRLKVIPWASRCITCQEKEELK
jgi:DnaK suppressor protein